MPRGEAEVVEMPEPEAVGDAENELDEERSADQAKGDSDARVWRVFLVADASEGPTASIDAEVVTRRARRAMERLRARAAAAG
jgi:hypothetical protein